MQMDPGGTANLAVLGGNLPPSSGTGRAPTKSCIPGAPRAMGDPPTTTCRRPVPPRPLQHRSGPGKRRSAASVRGPFASCAPRWRGSWHPRSASDPSGPWPRCAGTPVVGGLSLAKPLPWARTIATCLTRTKADGRSSRSDLVPSRRTGSTDPAATRHCGPPADAWRLAAQSWLRCHLRDDIFPAMTTADAAAARRDQVRELMALARRAPAHGENPVLAERKRRGL